MENNHSKNIIEKIKSNKIEPESKLRLNLKNYLVWLIWGTLMVLGALAFSIFLLYLSNFDPSFIRSVKLGRFFGFIFSNMPYFWLILILISIGSGFLLLRRTKRGYRLSSIFISSLVILIVLTIGAAAHFSKINNRLEKGFGRIPQYQNISPSRESRFISPEKGVLAGEILTVDKNKLEIETIQNQKWEVLFDEKTIISPRTRLEPNEKVLVGGEKVSNYTFRAKTIKSPQIFEKMESSPEVKGKMRGPGRPMPPFQN